MMKTFFYRLSEKDRRLYADVEVSKLGYGGLIYLCKLSGCSDGTAFQGQRDLRKGEIEKGRIRKPSGGRKSAFEKHPELDDIFLKVLKNHTVGDPMDENTQWTDLSNKEISQQDIDINKKISGRLLKRHRDSKCSMIKSIAIGSSENRNEQFENIAKLKKELTESGQPVISMDTKKSVYSQSTSCGCNLIESV